jgi:predicted nucleotidyltransferase
MKCLEGYSFDESLNMASLADIDGIKVPFLHINQLIANKKAVNRPKDQIDVKELERIKKQLDEPQ